MEKMKLFKAMTPQEQLKWLTDFTHWTNEKMPVLCALGDAWEKNSIKSMKEGLQLMTAFGYCRDFVDKTLLFSDFSRRIDRMQFYIDKIKKEIASGASVKSPYGDTLAYVPQLPARKRGRPTKAESAQIARERASRKLSEFMAGRISGPLKILDEDTCVEDKGYGKLFEGKEEGAEDKDKAASAPLPSPAGGTAVLANEYGRLHFDQLEWMMSAGLREDVKKVAGLRALAAKESNQAKELAENGVDASIIEPHSKASVEATNAYLEIYRQVDLELGRLYLKIKKSEAGGTSDYAALAAKRGLSIQQMKSILLPYYEKIGSPESLPDDASCGKPSVEDEAERKERSERLHRIRTYFIRKDLNLTQNRVDKMRSLIVEVKSYGLPVDEYEAILRKAEEDLSECNKEE